MALGSQSDVVKIGARSGFLGIDFGVNVEADSARKDSLPMNKLLLSSTYSLVLHEDHARVTFDTGDRRPRCVLPACIAWFVRWLSVWFYKEKNEQPTQRIMLNEKWNVFPCSYASL